MTEKVVALQQPVMDWAMRQKAGSSYAKVTLLCIAFRASAEGRCHVDYDELATLCRLSRQGFLRQLRKLEKGGFLRRVGGERPHIVLNYQRKEE